MIENSGMEMTTTSDGNNISFHQTIFTVSQEKWKDVLMEFVHKSTIPAVTLIHHRFNVFWKYIWFVVVICCLSISIHKGVLLVKNYHSYPSFITQVEKKSRALVMPSITLCNENRINWERVKETNHSILHIIEKRSTKLEETKNAFQMREELDDLLMRELNALDVNEREKILISIDDWFVSYIGSDAEGYQYTFQVNKSLHAFSYSPFYGKCITINPGFTETSKLKMGTNNDIIIIAEIKPGIEFPYMSEISGVRLTIHNSGAAPVLGWHKSLIILPGELVQIGIRVTDIQRLPSPYASNCIDEKHAMSKIIKNHSPYQSEKTPYSYSREECLATCHLRFLLEREHCYWPYIAMNDFYKSQRFNLCSVFNLNDVLVKADIDCDENCSRRCRELLYDWTATSSILTDGSKLVTDYLNSVTNKTITNNTNFIGICLKMETRNYVYAEETAKYQLEDIFGSIGGNLALWIGLSILSAFEIFELLTNAVAFFVRKLIKSKRN